MFHGQVASLVMSKLGQRPSSLDEACHTAILSSFLDIDTNCQIIHLTPLLTEQGLKRGLVDTNFSKSVPLNDVPSQALPRCYDSVFWTASRERDSSEHKRKRIHVPKCWPVGVNGQCCPGASCNPVTGLCEKTVQKMETRAPVLFLLSSIKKMIAYHKDICVDTVLSVVPALNATPNY